MPSAPALSHPADIAYALLGHDHWQGAREILDAVFRPRSRVAVKSCHASSKTFTSASAVVLALLEGADVLTTAPTWEQVRTVLWGNIQRALLDANVDLSSWDVNQTEIKTPSGAHAMGLSTNEGVRFQGWHARPDSYLLVIFDEAPGVMPDIHESVAGISAGGDVRWLQIGNPVISSGPFYDIFAADLPGWRRFTIDAFDTPNLAGLTLDDLLRMPEQELDENVRPYLVTRRWVRDRYYEWGPEHPAWQSRVRGQFPMQSTDALLSLAWLEAAKARPAAWTERGGEVIAGVDVAGPGEDETVVYVRQGPRILEMHAFPDADSRGRVLQALQPWLHKNLKRVNVDSAGSGHYFQLHLQDHLPKTVMVHGINVGESPSDDAAAMKYRNLKAELYWYLREQFRDGMVSGLTDQTTISQLASILWAPNSAGKTEIETKEKARKRGVKSPDRAEALMLAFAPTLADQLVVAAWQGQHTQTLTLEEARLPWHRENANRPGAPWAAQESDKQRSWLEGAKW